MESTSQPTLVAGKGTMSFVADMAWWKAAVACCRRFAPRCVLAAVLGTVAGIGLLVAFNAIEPNLSALQDTTKPVVISNTDTGLLQTLTTLMLAFGGATICCLVLFAALFIWFDKLHVFARAFALKGTDAADADFDEAAAFLKRHKKFLMVFWLVGSAYLLVPSVFFSLLISAKVLMSTELAAAIEVPFGLSRQMFGNFCLGFSAIFFIVILAYSLGGLVFASLANKAPARLATDLLRDMLRHPLQPLALTIVVSVLVGLIMTPFDAVDSVIPLGHVKSSLAYIIVSQVWGGVTSLIVLPLSVAPFCMITRHAQSN